MSRPTEQAARVLGDASPVGAGASSDPFDRERVVLRCRQAQVQTQRESSTRAPRRVRFISWTKPTAAMSSSRSDTFTLVSRDRKFFEDFRRPTLVTGIAPRRAGHVHGRRRHLAFTARRGHLCRQTFLLPPCSRRTFGLSDARNDGTLAHGSTATAIHQSPEQAVPLGPSASFGLPALISHTST